MQKFNKKRFRPQAELLEARTVLSATAVLDFDGDAINAAEMDQGGWSDSGLTLFNGFKSLFDSSRPWLDLNGNGVVNSTDANIAINRIVAKVKADYAPYDLNILVGDQDDYQHLLSVADTQHGDVLMMITGTENFVTVDDAYGVSPTTDYFNVGDELAWVFGSAIADDSTSASQFISRVARTISHEMGHCFGLLHVPLDAQSDDPETHHLMNVPPEDGPEFRDFDHDFNFQDIMYPTSDYNPETEGYEQNAHQHLTDVLGASTKPWLAVLKPGELTIMGDDNANTIIVSKGNGNKWSVSIGGVTTTLDASTPGLNSLNPFDAALSKIYIHGKGGSDTITVSVAAQSNVWGGLGNDTITGGAGADWFYGEAGNDKLYGNKGIDHLYGGADNDRLDGGFDGKTDVLRGESGADTFVVHRSKVFELNDAGKPVFVEWLDEIENMDFVVGTDLKVFIKHS